jgi:hypothetical protein
MNWRRADVGERLPAQRLDVAVVAGVLAEHVHDLTEEQQRAILCTNAAELYSIDLSALEARSLDA